MVRFMSTCSQRADVNKELIIDHKDQRILEKESDTESGESKRKKYKKTV